MVRSQGAAVGLILVCGLSATACGQAQNAQSASSPANPTQEIAAGPVRASLCDTIKAADLVSWLNAGAVAADRATCSADPGTSGAIRAYGKWTFPSTGRSDVEFVEISVYDDKLADGTRLFDNLKGSYTANEQRQVAGHYARVANTRGKSLINLPDLGQPVDIVLQTKSAATGDDAYASIRASHFGAFERLVPALIGG
ncbi:hypothetical protein [Actinosynnema sp. NPDC020468]|uniref:hypothetical protein n=1 Tax=Actinosynnema sp. NPDC020468 TaxID=3154488 RepID=UPI0033CA056B